MVSNRRFRSPAEWSQGTSRCRRANASASTRSRSRSVRLADFRVLTSTTTGATDMIGIYNFSVDNCTVSNNLIVGSAN